MRRITILSGLFTLIFGIIAITATPLFANPDFDLGPPINAKAPDIGTPRDFTGTPRSLQSLMGEKGLVLFFFRSADWCPFCQAQMMDLNTAVSGIQSRGYKLAGISYDMPEIQKTFRMYRKRPFDIATVSINYPDEEKGVRRFLDEQHATTRNYLSATMDPYELMKAFDPEWDGGVPYTMVIGPSGEVLYKGNGQLDILKTRRLILASLPDDDYVGQQAYWKSK